MTWRSFRAIIITLALVSMVAAAPLPAQNPKRPRAYSLTFIFSMTSLSSKAYRNGAKERIDLDVAASPDNPKEVHQVLFLDSATHKAYAEDPASHTCFSTPYPSAEDLVNYDPFFIPAAGTPAATLPPGTKMTGEETINGMATKVYEAQSTDGGITSTTKIWWSETYGMPLKMEAVLPNTPPMVVEETKELTTTAPPASLFTAPSGCKEAQGQWTPAGFELAGQKTVTLGAVTQKPQPSPLAAPSALPTQYTLTVVSTANDASFVTGRPATLKVYRNGSKERVDVTLPPGGGGSGFYGIYLFDFSAQKVYTTARVGNSAQSPWSCMKYPDTEARYGDDPITDSADIWETMAKMGTVKKTGAETLTGIPTEVEEVTSSGIQEKAWIDQEKGFIVKYSMVGPIKGGFEVKQMSFAPPRASLLATPGNCQYTGEWCRAGFCGGAGGSSTVATPKSKQ